ncbi:MAG: PAS domain S-box protein [Proteobacteria bacterium]|nr:PAS domain S-box protein [Pseudomonadota bacterium]
MKQKVEQYGSVSGFEVQFYRKDGTKIWVCFSVHAVRDAGGILQYYEGVLEDITERKQAEEVLRLTDIRQKTILQLYQMADTSLDTITGFVLEECVKISESELAFIGFINEDETIMHTHLWSQKAMEECAVDGKPAEFPLDKAGLWAEAIRQRKPIIVNNYSDPNPYKKGCPEGHVPLTRFMSIPLIDRDHVVLVAGLANKKEPYTESDITHISMLLEGMWNYVQRRNAEDRVRQSEEKYRSIFENSIMGIFRTTPDGHYLSANPAGAKMYGYKSQEEMIQSVTGMAHQIYVHPEDRKRFKELIESSGFAEGFEAEHYTKDGSKIWASMNARIIRDTSGAILYYETTSQNITKRKRAEDALRQSEEKYRSIFKNSVEGIFQTTPEGQYISVNPALARMIGYDSPEELKKGVTNLSKQGYVNPEDRVRYKKILEEQGIIKGFEAQHYRKDGNIIWVSINARAVKDEAGKVLYYEGTIEDITERKRAASRRRTQTNP